jgi:hypothetical protein
MMLSTAKIKNAKDQSPNWVFLCTIPVDQEIVGKVFGFFFPFAITNCR